MITVDGQCLAAFVFGTTVGVLVQRSRWCNTAALRDAMLFKSYRNTKALLVAMMILTVGFTAMISFGNGNPMRFDVGINQFVGLFLFGIGMVFAGACTVSSWVKTGYGNHQSGLQDLLVHPGPDPRADHKGNVAAGVYAVEKPAVVKSGGH